MARVCNSTKLHHIFAKGGVFATRGSGAQIRDGPSGYPVTKARPRLMRIQPVSVANYSLQPPKGNLSHDSRANSGWPRYFHVEGVSLPMAFCTLTVEGFYCTLHHHEDTARTDLNHRLYFSQASRRQPSFNPNAHHYRPEASP